MANEVEFLVKLKDMVSGGLNAINSTATKVFNSVSNSIATTKQKADTLPQSISAINTQLDQLKSTREISISKRQIREIDKEIAALENKLQKIDAPRRNTGGMGSMLRTGLAMAGIGGAVALGGSIANAGIGAEQQQISFEVMLGSAKKAQKMIGEIRQMGAATPFTSADLSKGAEMLLGFGVAQEKILPTMRMLGDVSRGNKDRFDRLTLAFSQATSAGRLQGQDLLQMINAGFNPLQQMVRDKVFPSMALAKEAMEKGAISSKMLELAFQSASGPGGQFFGMMEKQSQTVGGRLSTLMDNVQMIGLRLGTALLPAIGGFIDLTNYMMDNKDVAIMLAVAVGVLTVATQGATIAKQLQAFWEGVVNAIQKANPILLIVGLLILLGTWIYSICKKYEGWGNAMKAIWEIIKSVVRLSIISFQNFFEGSWYWVQKLWLNIRLFAETIVGIFNNVGRAIKLALSFDFAGAKEALTAKIYTQADKELEQLEKNETARRTKRLGEATAEAEKIKKNLLSINLTKKKAEETKTASNAAKSISTNDYTAAKDGGKDKKHGLDGVVDGVTGGGSKSVIINLGKFFDNIHVHAASFKEGMEDVERIVTEKMLRITNSANL